MLLEIIPHWAVWLGELLLELGLLVLLMLFGKGRLNRRLLKKELLQREEIQLNELLVKALQHLKKDEQRLFGELLQKKSTIQKMASLTSSLNQEKPVLLRNHPPVQEKSEKEVLVK